MRKVIRSFTLFILIIIGLSSLFICFATPSHSKTSKNDEAWYSKVVQLNSAGQHKAIVEFCERQPGFKKQARNRTLTFLCGSYFELKRFDGLFECLDCMEEKYNQGDQYIIDFPPTEYQGKKNPGFRADALAQACQVRGGAYLELGHYEKAIRNFEKFIELYRAAAYPGQIRNPDYLPGQESLITAYAFNNEKEKALSLWKKVFPAFKKEMALIQSEYPELRKSTVLDKNGRDWYTISGIARMYMVMGYYQEVCDTITDEYLQALRNLWDTRSHQYKGHFQIIPLEFMLNKARFETDQTDPALMGYTKLLETPEIHFYGTYYYMILHDLGRIYCDKGDMERGIEYFAESIDVIEQQRSTINTEASKIGFVGDKQAVYHDMVAALIRTGRYEKAFYYAERGKARALVDMLASKKHFTGGNRNNANQLVALLKELNKAETNILVHDKTDKAQLQSGVRSIAVQKKEKITQADPEMASLITVTPFNIQQLRILLPSNETLIEYFGSEEKFFAFVVTPNDIKAIKLNAKGLGQEVELFRKQITPSTGELRALKKLHKETPLVQLDSMGKNLYDKLIRPLDGMFTSRNLTIVPHGALHYLPFNALPTGDGHLIDTYNIRVLPSASVMNFLKARGESQVGDLIAFANPDIGDQRYDLPFAEAEARAILKIQPDSKIFIGKKASETAVKQFSNQFKRIHFATHGAFDPEKPLESGLLLTRDNNNDGILTVGELYDLNLNADLVTLSACETALGKVANGDDVVGFTRGFLYAGTNSIVSSLWKVDDEATSILMQEFYRSLEVSDKRTALRKAQLKLKNSHYPHPVFWAAFQITGAIN